MARAKPVLPQHTDFLDEHFGVESKWDSFRRNLKNEQFVDAVKQDTRSDRKLKRFSKQVGIRDRSKQPGLSVVGDSGAAYKIKFHPETKRLSCSCNDWTYKRSVKNRGPQGDCKHISRMKNTMAGQKLTKEAVALGLARIARGIHKEDKAKDQRIKLKIQHEAYKKHFPRKSLIHDVIFKSAAAEVRGDAAAAFLDGAKMLSLHPRM